MGNNDLAPPAPLSERGRLLFGLNLVGLLTIWLIGLYAYTSLEGLIPIHFNIAGAPDAYGSGSEFLIMPPVLSIAPLVIVLMTRYRFTLVNNYPYLINLPAFYAYIYRIPVENRSRWINRYFEAILALGVLVTFFMNLMLWGIYSAALEESMPGGFFPSTVLTIPLAIPIMFYYFYRLSKQMKKEMTK
jgi:hypothetical protein